MNEPSFYTVSDREVLLRVKAKPHARENGVIGVRAGELIVAVHAPAEKGKATAEVAQVLARALGVPRTSVVLKSGGGSPHKVFVVPLEAATALRGFGPDSPPTDPF